MMALFVHCMKCLSILKRDPEQLMIGGVAVDLLVDIQLIDYQLLL